MNTQIISYMTNFKAILAVDFDLTICDSNYPKLGDEIQNAGYYIRKLVKEGYGIIINTCREGFPLTDGVIWLHRNGIPYHYINCNFPHIIMEYGADCRKISADLYIDDKQLGGLPSWKVIYEAIIEKFEPGKKI